MHAAPRERDQDPTALIMTLAAVWGKRKGGGIVQRAKKAGQIQAGKAGAGLPAFGGAAKMTGLPRRVSAAAGRYSRKRIVYPFIHIGPVTLGTYGLLVATAMLVAFFVLRADFRRREMAVDAETIIGVTGIVGLIGARVYSLLETPKEFWANPWPMLFSKMGFTWFGALITGMITLWLLARRYRVPMLLMLDCASPAAAIGYGVGRIGCLISGDGDYGTPTSLPWGMSFPNGIVPTTQRVHPTPIYEFLGAVVIFWILWQIGAGAIAGRRAYGRIAGYYLILTGIARFFVEFIRLNPRTIYGLTNAQAVSIVSVVLGVVMLLMLRSAPPLPPKQKAAAKA
jgi:phosphatidylglycerol---prolipoprotein diacylglyceryl transferase